MRIIVFASLFIFSLLANAEYTFICKESTSIFDSYIDFENTVRSGDKVRVLYLGNSKEKFTYFMASGEAMSTIMEVEYDCAAKKATPHRMTYFSGEMGTGRVVYDNRDKDLSMLSWTAEDEKKDKGCATLERVCKVKK